MKDYNWNEKDVVEVDILENDGEDNFLIIKETLTRIGVAVPKTSTLYQTAHILHRGGRYYITHFKELFGILDGRPVRMTDEDKKRRDTIISLLEVWGLIEIDEDNRKKLDADAIVNDEGSLYGKNVKIISFRDKEKWELKAKFRLGNS